MSLIDKATLIQLKTGVFSPYKRDNKATAIVESTAQLSRVGNFNKRILRDSVAFKNTVAAYRAVYQHWFKNTVPWLDDEGCRMVANENLLELLGELRALKSTAESELFSLVSNWQGIVADDLKRLGSLANLEDYPKDIARYFYINHRVKTISNPNDFRVALPEEEKKQLLEEAAEAEKVAVESVMKTILQPVSVALKRLKDYTGQKDQRFHASLIENVVDVVSQARRLNITGNSELADVIKELDSIITPVAFNPSMVKESVTVKEALQSRLGEMESKLAGFL